MANRLEQFEKIQNECKLIFEKKNADYGDSFSTHGVIGVIVRISDKISRLTNITNKKITMVSDEGIRDTLLDLHNYAAMAIMLLDENIQSPKMTMNYGATH
jgi:hypothetical protein